MSVVHCWLRWQIACHCTVPNLSSDSVQFSRLVYANDTKVTIVQNRLSARPPYSNDECVHMTAMKIRTTQSCFDETQLK